jgi:hypothetical protein
MNRNKNKTSKKGGNTEVQKLRDELTKLTQNQSYIIDKCINNDPITDHDKNDCKEKIPEIYDIGKEIEKITDDILKIKEQMQPQQGGKKKTRRFIRKNYKTQKKQNKNKKYTRKRM